MSRTKVRSYVAETREDLGATMDEIEYRLRPDVMAKKLGAWVQKSWDEDHTPWLIAVVITAIGAAAAVMWALFDDD